MRYLSESPLPFTYTLALKREDDGCEKAVFTQVKNVTKKITSDRKNFIMADFIDTVFVLINENKTKDETIFENGIRRFERACRQACLFACCYAFLFRALTQAILCFLLIVKIFYEKDPEIKANISVKVCILSFRLCRYIIQENICRGQRY